MSATLVHAGAVARAVLAVLGTTALHGAVLATLAYVVCRACKLRPATQAAIWLVVIAKLALPWAPALPFSLADLATMLRGAPTQYALPPGLVAHAAAPAPASLVAPLAWLLLAVAWALGAVVVLGRGLHAEVVARRVVARAHPAPESALAILATLGGRTRLVVGAPGSSPHVVGVLRPTIVIPPLLATETALLRAALAHELAHVRRRDGLARLVQLAARTLTWWFPLTHLANRRLELVREQACDDWALATGALSRPDYARLLVRMTSFERTFARPTPGLALAAPRALDARITAIISATSLGRLRLSLAQRAVLLAVIPVALGGARTAVARPHAEVCVYSPELAEALIERYPDADRDGDGMVTREEACDFQAEYRRRVGDDPALAQAVADPALGAEAPSSELLAEPLCCNCGESAGFSPAPTSPTETRCYRDEGEYIP